MSEILFQKVAAFQYSSEAIIFKGKLESEGIQVFMRDNNTVDSNPIYSNAIGGVKLYVKTIDFEKAQKSLSEVSKYSIDDDGESIKCPNCGAEKLDFSSTIKDIKSFLAFLFSCLIMLGIPFYTKYKYKCEECNFEFE
jgi:rubredoxin